MSVKEQVKNYAYELGADLIGFGGIDRCKNAPRMMSPQGLYPEAKTVIVMGVHHPDACVELGGETHPQDSGPYTVQYMMNNRLDEMSYRMATFLERAGYGAVPIVSSNIWRYKQYKQLDAVFAPDVSHIYMAVVAGLSEIGYSGISLTPEYGPRNRFVTVITNAEIEEDPLIPPGTVCDNCMLCRQHCPAEALSKEIRGEKVLRIGPYEYRFPNKNLWRCAWGEHFNLDLDLPIPDEVTEEVILETIATHGTRRGEMGQCLKFCVPRQLRTFDRSYSKSPVRRLAASLDESLAPRGMIDRLLAKPFSKGCEEVIVTSSDELAARGVNLEEKMPGAKSAITIAMGVPENAGSGEFRFGATHLVDFACFDLTRGLEALGFRSVMTVERGGVRPRDAEGPNITGRVLAGIAGLSEQNVIANTVITRMEITPQRRGTGRAAARIDIGNAQTSLTSSLEEFARSLGADLFGIAPVTRFAQLAKGLRPLFDGEELLDARDRSTPYTPWDPEVTVRQRTVKVPEDYLPGAKSVVVFGLRLHTEVIRWATKPPAEAVGPYAFQTYVTNWVGALVGARLVKRLEELGHKAVMVRDLMGTASVTANPRGLQADLRSNRFAALAAGVGYLTDAGHIATRQFGIRQRFIAIVTDAQLEASALYTLTEGERLCDNCDHACVNMCPTNALAGRQVHLRCENHVHRFTPVDGKRCDWAKRYVVAGDSGFKYVGSEVDIVPGAEVTAESLADALRQHDPITKYRPVVAEPCVITCPYANADVRAQFLAV
jgi:epoxyqueuosine reductase QueG